MAAQQPGLDVRSLAGAWHGYAGIGYGTDAYTWIIAPDGSVRYPGNPKPGMQIAVSNGLIWSAPTTGEGGILRVSQENGQRVLRGTNNGSQRTFYLLRGPDVAAALPVEWLIIAEWKLAGRTVNCLEADIPSATITTQLIGNIPPSLDITNESLMRQLFAQGKQYVSDLCRHVRSRPSSRLAWYLKIHSASSSEWSVAISEDEKSQGSYVNYAALAAQNMAMKRAEEDRQRQAAAAAQASRDAQQKAARDKIESFQKRARVEAWLGPAEVANFTSNPFPWKGKVVGLVVEFGMMKSETSAIFSAGGTNFIVLSNVPATRFTRPGQRALVAGRVQGVTQASLPILGTVPVPEVAMSAVEDVP